MRLVVHGWVRRRAYFEKHAHVCMCFEAGCWFGLALGSRPPPLFKGIFQGFGRTPEGLPFKPLPLKGNPSRGFKGALKGRGEEEGLEGRKEEREHEGEALKGHPSRLWTG